MLGADGSLMPAKKGQKPPDLRYFNQRRSGPGGHDAAGDSSIEGDRGGGRAPA